MKNRFSNRETLNLQVGGLNGPSNNPLQPNGEIRAESGAAAALRVVQDLGNFQPSRSLTDLGLLKGAMKDLGIVS
jgi:hypothetical protein